MFDFHTHRLLTPPGTGIVCLPQEVLLHPDRWLDADGHLPHAAEGALYAAGIHPWWLAQPDFSYAPYEASLRLLLQLPEVVQLGECGIDTLQGALPAAGGSWQKCEPAPVERQEAVFCRLVELSESCRKPVTLHCVRAFERILRLHRLLNPQQKWTIHGFRGKPQLARQLLAAGIDLSFGPRRNEESYALTPPDRRHDETDAE